MATKRRVILTGGPAHKGWVADTREGRPIVAGSVADLSAKVRERLGDQAWTWRFDLGEDTDYYIDLVRHYYKELREGLLANEAARRQLADAVWALGIGDASDEDAAHILGVPLDWVRQVWPSPDAYIN